MQRGRLTWREILYEMMALEIAYHGDFSLLDACAPNF
jgi:hypothetical protein